LQIYLYKAYTQQACFDLSAELVNFPSLNSESFNSIDVVPVATTMPQS